MTVKPAPPIRALSLIWLTLILLSVGTLFTGQVSDKSSIGPVWMLGLLAVTFFKSVLILNYFLDLKAATRGWSQLFIILLLIILILIYGIYVVGIFLI